MKPVNMIDLQCGTVLPFRRSTVPNTQCGAYEHIGRQGDIQMTRFFAHLVCALAALVVTTSTSIAKQDETYTTPVGFWAPGQDVGVGEYEAQIEARGQSGSEVVEALEKRLKIRISAETNITATLILVLGLVLISGIVLMGVKLSRR